MISKEQEEKIRREIILLVKMFLETNLSDIELEKRTGISSSTVGRRLTDKQRILEIYHPNGLEIYKKVLNMRKENLYNGKVKGGMKAVENTIYSRSEDGKFNGVVKKIDVKNLSENPNNQLKILYHMALTYRCKTITLESLTGINEKELYDLFVRYCGGNSHPIDYLNNNDYTDQELAAQNMLDFYNRLLHYENRYQDQDGAKQIMRNTMLKEIDDTIVNSSFSKREKGKKFKDEEILALIKYLVKYSLTQKQVIEHFELGSHTFSNNAERVLDEYSDMYPDLKRQYDALIAYNESWTYNQYREGR